MEVTAKGDRQLKDFNDQLSLPRQDALCLQRHLNLDSLLDLVNRYNGVFVRTSGSQILFRGPINELFRISDDTRVALRNAQRLENHHIGNDRSAERPGRVDLPAVAPHSLPQAPKPATIANAFAPNYQIANGHNNAANAHQTRDHAMLEEEDIDVGDDERLGVAALPLDRPAARNAENSGNDRSVNMDGVLAALLHAETEANRMVNDGNEAAGFAPGFDGNQDVRRFLAEQRHAFENFANRRERYLEHDQHAIHRDAADEIFVPDFVGENDAHGPHNDEHGGFVNRPIGRLNLHDLGFQDDDDDADDEVDENVLAQTLAEDERRASITDLEAAFYQEPAPTCEDPDPNDTVTSDKQGNEYPKCSFCLNYMKPNQELMSLKCGHTFHRRVLEYHLQTKAWCPICRMFCADEGTQPEDGKMEYLEVDEANVPEFVDCNRMYQITYTFPDGVQGDNHPVPGYRYTGGSFFALLPVTPTGTAILRMLELAFKNKLLFAIEQTTDGNDEFIVVLRVCHKGERPDGYPDPQLLTLMEEQLRTMRITRELVE